MKITICRIFFTKSFIIRCPINLISAFQKEKILVLNVHIVKCLIPSDMLKKYFKGLIKAIVYQ